MNDNIVLIGFMGSGKTTFGKWISRKYGYSFCDTDEYIEKKENTKAVIQLRMLLKLPSV